MLMVNKSVIEELKKEFDGIDLLIEDNTILVTNDPKTVKDLKKILYYADEEKINIAGINSDNLGVMILDNELSFDELSFITDIFAEIIQHDSRIRPKKTIYDSPKNYCYLCHTTDGHMNYYVPFNGGDKSINLCDNCIDLLTSDDPMKDEGMDDIKRIQYMIEERKKLAEFFGIKKKEGIK